MEEQEDEHWIHCETLVEQNASGNKCHEKKKINASSSSEAFVPFLNERTDMGKSEIKSV